MTEYWVGQVIEATREDYPDVKVQGKIREIDWDGDLRLDGLGGFIAPDLFEVKILREAREVGDSYTSNSGERLVYIGRDDPETWLYTVSGGRFVWSSDETAQALLSQGEWRKNT